MLTGNKISTKALMLLGILITILDIILANMSDKKYIAMQITEKNNSFLKLFPCVYNVYPPPRPHFKFITTGLIIY